MASLMEIGYSVIPEYFFFPSWLKQRATNIFCAGQDIVLPMLGLICSLPVSIS